MYTQEEYINPLFTDRPHWDILTTTVYSLSTASSSATPWPYAAVDAVNSPLLHPITLKPHPNLPADLNLQNFDTTAVGSFHHTDISFDKLVKIDDGVFLVLYGGGTLLGRLRLPCFKEYEWVRLGQEEFDDVVIFVNKIHAVDRTKKLCFVNINKSRNRWRLGKRVAFLPLISRWRKRLVVDGAHLYMVARTSSTYFSVFELDSLDESGWSEVWEFDGGKVLFVSKDCCFFMSGFGGSEYRNCIVFSEAGFPSCHDWRTLTKWGDDIWVFRLSDGRYGKVGATARFPDIDWSPPSWIFDGGSCLSMPSRSHSQREGNEEDGKVQSDPNESNSEHEEQDERVVSKIQSDANIDGDADASLLSQQPPPPPPRTSTQPYPRKFNDPSFTDRCHWDILTTTIHSLSSSSATPWPCAAIDDNNSSFLHPLTLKPHHNLNTEVNLNNFKTTALTSFYHTNFSFDKIVKIDDSVMLVLYGGGKLIGRLPRGNEWVRLRQKQFDDIVVFMDKIHAVDRYGRLSLVNVNNVKNTWKLGKMVVSGSIVSQWRERLVVDGGHLYLVIRHDERKFLVYKLVRLDKSYGYEWTCVSGFDSEKVFFVSKDCCFFMKGFGGRKYRNCIVYSESGFPLFNNHCWRTVRECEDEIWVYRMRDRRSGKVGESVDFPEIDWSPPSWIFDGGSCSFPHSRSHSEGEGDEEDGGVQSDSKESNTEDEDDKEIVMLDSDSHDQEQEERVDSEIESDANIERDASFPDDALPSLLADVAAVEEQVTKTLRMSGGNEAIEEESSRENITLSEPRACTSSSTNKRHKIDTATAKFEGFDIRCDLVPTLQKIWRNHGNITENSTIRNYDITARALESLAIVVQILENTSVGSLSDCQADYLSSTLSDLKFMSFKVHWLSSFVEKVVKLHKSKALVDCLHKLGQLSSQVTERRAILLDEVAKLNEEENKLKKEMATVSKLFPFSEQLKYDESLGAELT